MSNSGSYQQMARQFIELWQRQVSAMMSDSEFVTAMLDMMKNASASGATYEPGLKTAHAATASESQSTQLAELQLRLRVCEERLAALELAAKKPTRAPARPGAAGKRPAKRSTRKK